MDPALISTTLRSPTPHLVRRFLICTAWTPWGPSRGFQHRLSMVSEALSSLGRVDVCVLERWRSPELEQQWPPWVGDAEWCRVEQPERRGIAAMLERRPAVEDRVAPDAMAAANARFFSRPYDLTWCAEPRGYHPVADLVSGPCVLDLHNVLSSSVEHKRKVLLRRPWLAASWRQAINDPVYRPGIGRRWREWEQQALRSCDRIAVCSEVDRARVGEAASVIPNCYRRPDRPAGRVLGVGGRLRIGFVGLLDYQPNFDAVQWFVKSVFPVIRRIEGEAEFVVIGREAPGLQPLSQHPGVRFLGFVQDLEPELAQLSVLIAPIRFGGGTRFKVLEAFAHEIPMVSTTVGVEGIDAEDGCHLFIRDDPENFAFAVVEAHRNRILRERMVTSAKELYEQRYTWERGLAAVKQVVDELTVGHRSKTYAADVARP